MSKALFLGLPLHGHTNPSLPLVRALVERGDEVVYASTEPFAAKIREAGARYHPYQMDLSELAERTDKLAWLLMRTTGEVLARDLETFRSERPDYIITDSVAPWGQWVGQILQVPVVTSVTTFAINRHVLMFAVTRGTRPKSARLVFSKLRHITKALLLRRQLRLKYGVPGTGMRNLVFGSSDLNIVYTSREFQPCAETFDGRYLFIGPSIGARAEEPSAVSDQDPQIPLIYISLGTLFNVDSTFYRACFSAFGGENVRVIMSVGAATTAASLGTAPPNFVVKPWVPQLEVLRHAAVFVSHGGMNSVSESLHNGVPLVVVPQMGEQEMVAKQVDRVGAGLYVAKHEVSAERLRQSVQRLLSGDGFREQAARVRQSFDAAGGVARGADAILAFTRAHHSA